MHITVERFEVLVGTLVNARNLLIILADQMG
jgi:hypothetical protein